MGLSMRPAVFVVVIISGSFCKRNDLSTIRIDANEKMSSARIVNGKEATPHSLPYQVYLKTYTIDRIRLCGGSLISRAHILTAAHCLKRSNRAIILLGAHDISRTEANRVIIRVNARNFRTHPGYSENSVYNDIAIISFPRPVTLSENIQVINLPRRSQTSLSFEGREVVASGWGKFSDMAEDLPTRLQIAILTVVPLRICRDYFSIIRFATHICARGENNQSVCGGDSGGPLALKKADGSRILIGLTSFGSRTSCLLGIPGVFTRVSSYLNWISSNTGIEIRE